MLGAIDDDVAIPSWDFNNGVQDKQSPKISELVLDIFSKGLPEVDVERITKALSYVALKIEDLKLAEQVMLACQHGDLEALAVILREIKQRPESFLLANILNEIFTDALEEGDDEIVDLMWEEMGDILEVDDAYYALDNAIERGDAGRARWIVEKIEMDDIDAEEFIIDALKNNMFFVVELLFDKYEDQLCPFELTYAFKDIIERSGEVYLQGAQYLWPKVKDRVDSYTLNSALRNAEIAQNRPMVDFLRACLLEKGGK